MKSPLVIIVELLIGIISTIYKTLVFISNKLMELVLSLLYISTFGILGFIIAFAIGAAILLLITKFVFRSWKSLFFFCLVLAVVVIIMLLAWTA